MKKTKTKRLFRVVNSFVVFISVFSVFQIPPINAEPLEALPVDLLEAEGIPVIDPEVNDRLEEDENEINETLENEMSVKTEENLTEIEENQVSKEVIVEEYVFRFIGTDGNSTASIIGYLGSDTDLVLPNEAINEAAGWDEPSPVTSIGESAFQAKQLTSVNLPEDLTNIFDNAFRDNQLTSVEFGGSLTNVGPAAFANNQLTSVMLPDSLRNIGISGFGNNQLTSIVLPDNFATIGMNAFANNMLTNVELGNTITTISSGAFMENQLTSIELPDSLQMIGSQAFLSNMITSIRIPDNVTSIGSHAFRLNPLQRIQVSSSHIDRIRGLLTPMAMNGVSVRAILETTEGGHYVEGTLDEYKVNTKNRTLGFEVVGGKRYQIVNTWDQVWGEITGEVKEIEWFKNGKTTGIKTKNLTLSNVSKNDIGEYYAVIGETQLSGINVVVDDYVFEFSGEDGDSTATVFDYIGTSTAIEIPSEAINYEAGWKSASPLLIIGKNAFDSKNLVNVVIPNSVLEIKLSAFSGNVLEDIVIGESVNKIDAFAFYGNKLTNLEIPNSVKTILNNVFSQNSLTSVKFGNGLRSIGASVFNNNPLERIRVSTEQINPLKGLLTPGVMNGVTERTILETNEGFSYEEGTKERYSLIEGESVQFDVEGKGYQLGDLTSRNWEEWRFQWLKENVDLNIDSRQFDLLEVTELDTGKYRAVVGEGSFKVELPEIEVLVVPRKDREIPSINPEDPTVNPIYPNPEISALGIRYVSSFSFGKIPFSKTKREVISTGNVETDGTIIPHMITIQDAREKASRNGWELTAKQESNVIDGSEIILNPYIHELNSQEYGVEISSSELRLNGESQQIAAVEGGSLSAPGIFSIGLSGSGSDGVRLSVPGGAGIGTYQTKITWVLTEGP